MSADHGNSFLPGIQGTWVFFGRILLGLFWLHEITVGHNRKIFNPLWMGPGAGGWLAKDMSNAVEICAGTPFAFFAEWIILPLGFYFSYIVTFFQLALALALIFGIAIRPMSIVALGHIFIMFMCGHWRIPSFYAIGHLFVLMTGAGQFYGFDGWFLLKTRNHKQGLSAFFRRFIAFDCFSGKISRIFFPVLALAGIYMLLQASIMEVVSFRRAYIELFVLFSLVASGIYCIGRGADRLWLAARGLQLFIGYRFLHEIWSSFPVALNGLPGWSKPAELQGVLEFVGMRHWAFMGLAVEFLFLPVIPFWAVCFAVAQTISGILLIIHVKPGLAAKLGLGYLTLLILLGFTRYAPFMLGFLILAHALDEGNLRIPRVGRWIALGLGIGFACMVFIFGMTPGEYRDPIGPMLAVIIALFSMAMFFVASIQNAGWFKAR